MRLTSLRETKEIFLGGWEERRDLGKDGQTQAEGAHMRSGRDCLGDSKKPHQAGAENPGHPDLLFHYGVSVAFQDIHLKQKWMDRRPGSMCYIHWVEPASGGKTLFCSPAVPLQVCHKEISAEEKAPAHSAATRSPFE